MRFRSFASDNNSGVHPAVLEALVAANADHAIAYGDDPWSHKLEQRFRELFGDQVESFLVYGGTGANVLALKSLAVSHQAVFCSASAHIHVDECGAPEHYVGCKLIPIPSPTGKISPEQLLPHLSYRGNPHHVQPKVLSIAQSTEVGTVYGLAELKDLTDFAHQHGIWVHLDGARLSNAAAFLGVTLRELTAGVDVVTFGGTKNGLMYGEAVIFLNPGLSEGFPYIRKQGMQLASKMRFAAAQFLALLEDDRWLSNAKHANRMARELGKFVAELPGFELAHPVESNGVFCRMPPELIEPLQSKIPFYVWEEDQHIVRWMTSFETTQADLDLFRDTLRQVVS